MELFKRWNKKNEQGSYEAKSNELKNVEQTAEDVVWFKRLMSHNIRMPLAIIGGYCELLLSDSVLSEEEKLDYIKNISKNVDFIDTLTKVVLDDNQNHLLDEKETIDLLEEVRKVAEYLKNIANKSGVRITINSTDEAVLIRGNRIVILRAFFNLFENSLRYMNKEGEITITMEEQEGEVLVVYRDDGVGMEASKVENVLKLYYRGDSEQNKGTGMGMYLVAEAVKAHNGTIEVRSDVGKGFAVYITFPSNL